MKKAFIAPILFGLTTLFAIPAFADTTCQPIYGGGQSCVQTGNILINKTVMNPSTNVFVDNLSVNDPHYVPNGITTFQLVVTNTGSATLSTVDVKDIFPQFVTFASGPGTFDSNTKTLSFQITNLNPGESRTFTITGNIVSSSQLPSNQISCVVNQATATSNGQTSTDNAQFCVENPAPTSAAQPVTTKGGLPVFPAPAVTTTPKTGPEALALAALLPTGLFGQFLRKKASK